MVGPFKRGKIARVGAKGENYKLNTIASFIETFAVKNESVIAFDRLMVQHSQTGSMFSILFIK